MEFELNDFLNGLLCRKDIKIKQPINSNTIAEAVNEYLKNKPASPPSMPEPTVEEALKEYYKWYCIDSEPHKEDEGYENRKVIAELMINFSNQMRSQCDKIISQKEERIKELEEKLKMF